ADVRSVVLGVAGVDSASDEAWFHERLLAMGLPRATWVVNDLIPAWAAGTGGAPGIALIAGTGSNALGVNASGEAWRAGGWGHILGDEGSGYWLGLHGMQAAVTWRDGRGRPTRLAEYV